jgi:hypothetical protein
MPLRSDDAGIFFPNDSSCWCALLCDNDGRIIHDFGKRGKGRIESIALRSLVGLLESGSLAGFLDTVRSCGITRGWELKIHYGGVARKILLHGFQTPQGILVFAPLPPYSEKPAGRRSADSSRVTPPRPRARKQKDTIDLFQVAHNLQNPVSSIVSACEYLVTYSQANLNPEQLEMIAGIESAAAVLLQLSRQLSERVKQGSRATNNPESSG